MDFVVDATLLAILAATAITILRVRNLFAAVMLTGIYSLVSAALFTTLDAVDVAFTEAAVGAGISTVLFLGTLALVGKEEQRPTRRPLLPLVVVLITGAALVYGTLDLPDFGDPQAPAHQHLAPDFIEGSEEDIGIPNVVTSVLASYRGYDTMGETTVVFAALVAVLLLLSRGRRPIRVWDEERGWISVWSDREPDPDERTPGGSTSRRGDAAPDPDGEAPHG